MTPSAAENLYIVRWSVAGCAFDLRVNDGPVFERVRPQAGVAEAVVNRWVKEGPNTLTARLSPSGDDGQFTEDTAFEAKVFVQENGADDSTRRELAKIEYRAGQPPLIAGAFAAAVPFGEWIWMTAARIEDHAATLDSLVAELRSFRELLERQDVAAAVERVRVRDEEVARAHYAPAEMIRERTRRELTVMTTPGEGELQPLVTEGLRLRLFGDGRLARVDRQNGTSPIFYRTPARSFTVYVPLVFCRGEAGWTIVR